MKRQTLVNGLLSLTAVSLMTGCVDDKYDLSDIDTTSRFTVDNLTVPVNLAQIKLENVIDFDEDGIVQTLPGEDGKDYYAIVEDGEIAPKEFSIDPVEVSVPTIDGTSLDIRIPAIPGVQPGTYIPVAIPIPAIDVPASPLVAYTFKNDNVPESLVNLMKISTTPINVKVTLQLPSELIGSNNQISFDDLHLQLPQDLIGVTGKDVDVVYTPKTGLAVIKNVQVDPRTGKATINISANGLDLSTGNKGEIRNHILNISGQVGVLEGGKISLKLQGINLPENIHIDINYEVSSFNIASFSGDVNYKMDAIHIDPISLNDLPDFLDSPETNILIANPQILVGIDNPVGKYGLKGEGRITLTSNFKNGISKPYSSGLFELKGERSDLAFCTPKSGYVTVPFEGLREVLSDGNSGLPSSIEVDIQDIIFKGHVDDLPIGSVVGTAEGSYEFNAPLAFDFGSMVVYETTEDGWGGDDLDDVHITKINLEAYCSTDLPVSINLTVVPVDKDGKEIEVEESHSFVVPANAKNEHVRLSIKAKNADAGGTITDFDGVKFRAVVLQDSDNTEALGPDLYINLDDLRVTVDGYYETDF